MPGAIVTGQWSLITGHQFEFTMARKNTAAAKQSKADREDFVHIRSLAHDLSNSLEAILQAAYLLNQSKLDANAKRWAQMIDLASQEAARLNREIRKALRALSGD